ncbi:unnamed protein product, partial [Prorocentrum cordatum]
AALSAWVPISFPRRAFRAARRLPWNHLEACPPRSPLPAHPAHSITLLVPVVERAGLPAHAAPPGRRRPRPAPCAGWRLAACLARGAARGGVGRRLGRPPGGRRRRRASRAAADPRASALSVLSLSEGASRSDVKRRFKELVATEHPDKRPGDLAAAERFKAVVAAYEELASPGGAPEPGPAPTASRQTGPVEVEVDEVEVDPESVAALLLFACFGVAVVLLSQVDLRWQTCYRSWEWWCSLKGLA